MACDELANKLNRRLKIEEGEEAPPALAEDGGDPQNGDSGAATTAAADSELSAKLQRRSDLNEGIGDQQQPSLRVFNPYTEFKEFSRKQIKDMERMFKEYDAGKDNFIDLMELKLMMEKLGAPQTHLGLKNMIKEVDEDIDGKLNFREFLLIFRKAAAGELQEGSGLHALARLSEIDVSAEGVKGAKSFFEAKVLPPSCESLGLFASSGVVVGLTQCEAVAQVGCTLDTLDVPPDGRIQAFGSAFHHKGCTLLMMPVDLKRR